METGDDETKADDEETEEKEDDEEAEEGQGHQEAPDQDPRRSPRAAQVFRHLHGPRRSPAANREEETAPPRCSSPAPSSALTCSAVTTPEAAAFYAKKNYGDEDMAREFKAMSVTNPTAGGFPHPRRFTSTKSSKCCTPRPSSSSWALARCLWRTATSTSPR